MLDLPFRLALFFFFFFGKVWPLFVQDYWLFVYCFIASEVLFLKCYLSINWLEQVGSIEVVPH